METTLRISSSAVSDKGLNDKRPENEDSYLELPDHGVFAVADGVGGAQAGDVASQMAMEILEEAFVNRKKGTDPEAVMQAAIERANSAIFQMAHDLPQLSSMATTVVALHLNGNIATIGHVGDSRLYRVDRDGNLFRETDDHSMVAEEMRAGRMTEEQAENHPSRNIISRALGAENSVLVDTKTVMIDGGTAFLLCSDGVTRHVSDQEIKGVLTFGGSPSDICQYLKDLCYHRGAEDNLTAVVVKAAASDFSQIQPNKPYDLDNSQLPIELDEPTVTAARTASSKNHPPVESNDLLELAGEEQPIAGKPDDPDRTAGCRPDQGVPEVDHYADANISPASTAFTIEPARPIDSINSSEGGEPDGSNFSIFGSGGSPATQNNGSASSLSKALSAVALLALGAILGVATYYFMAPRPVDTDGPKLTEMRAANIPLSAFEENRRNVDKDPGGYIARFAADPQDCEDHYLLARAYLLAGDYSNARNALIKSREMLTEADPANAAVLASDIAIAMSVTNGTTVQSMLKKELESSKLSNVNTSTNPNSNR
jgi:serine/threonine protein phosphatase PrpC